MSKVENAMNFGKSYKRKQVAVQYDEFKEKMDEYLLLSMTTDVVVAKNNVPVARIISPFQTENEPLQKLNNL